MARTWNEFAEELMAAFNASYIGDYLSSVEADGQGNRFFNLDDLRGVVISMDMAEILRAAALSLDGVEPCERPTCCTESTDVQTSDVEYARDPDELGPKVAELVRKFERHLNRIQANVPPRCFLVVGVPQYAPVDGLVVEIQGIPVRLMTSYQIREQAWAITADCWDRPRILRISREETAPSAEPKQETWRDRPPLL